MTGPKLEGQTIETVRPMTPEEEDEYFTWGAGRGETSMIIVLESGQEIFPAQDTDLNGPGVLFSTEGENLYIHHG